ncbi:UNVERIFIED_ORG: NitT/TauT family transport system substrate-binding protein [Paenarthrobacter nicotinovorans]
MPGLKFRGGRAVAALSALTLLGTSLAACAGPTSSADASEKFNVAVYAGNVVSLYAYIGASEGFYKNEGLDVTLVETTAGPQATAALSSGSIDVMLNSPDNALNAKQQGFDSVVIAGNLKKPLFQLVVKDKANFPHISDGYPAVMQDVVGKKVSTYVLGSSIDRLGKLLLNGAGLPTDSATFVPVGGPGQGATALDAGQVDVLMDAFNPAIAAEIAGKGSVLLDCSIASCGKAADAAGAMSQAYWTTQKALDKKTADFRAFVTAQGKIHAWATDPANSKALLAIMQKYLPVPAGVDPSGFYSELQELMPRYFSVEVNKDAINANMEAMLEMGDLKSPVETSSMVWSEARLTTAP